MDYSKLPSYLEKSSSSSVSVRSAWDTLGGGGGADMILMVHPCRLLNDTGIEIPELWKTCEVDVPGCMVIMQFLVEVRHWL